MKKLTTVVCALFLLGLTANFTFATEIITGKTAFETYQGAKLVRYSNNQQNIPSYLSFYQGQEVDLDGAYEWMKKNFGLSNRFGLKLLHIEKDKLGFKHYRYAQTFDGKIIEYSFWILHTKNDLVQAMNGYLVNEIALSTPSISENTALNLALAHVGADEYKWEVPAEEQHLKWESGDASATYYPEGTMVYIPLNGDFKSGEYRLAYKFNIYAHSELYRANVYIDALSGEVLFENELIHELDTPGTAETAYSGTQDIIADSFGSLFRLRDGSRGLGINTYDMNTGTTYGSAVDFIDDDNNWDYTGPDLDEYAYDAHWGAEQTYDYYDIIHGRNSIDDAGFALNSYVHYDAGYVNAFWDGSRMTYGDGNATYSPLTSIDIAGHEITHGLTSFTADLIYSAESGALNESFSDIFGTAIENYARPLDWNWLIGEDIGSAFRSMSNPNAFSDPDTYFGDFWADLAGGDAGGVHTNSGVQNFWYYLLTEGGTGVNDNGDAYTVVGQGFSVSSAVAFRNLTVYLGPSSGFEDARFYAIQSAIDLYGACSPEVESVTNAWYAVGVGVEYTDEVLANFIADITVSCSAPFTVEFTNLSVNGTSFEWDFGDGTSSIVSSPSHEYSTIDTFTVQLIADGGACGIDTLTLVDYILVDPDMPCDVIMPTDGIGSTQTSCSGTLYDSGGDGANYGANEDAQITIQPAGASQVEIEFLMFDVEAGPSGTCNYDYLEVYDGPSSASPLIARYCNNNLPPATLLSTGDALTFVFHSDPGVQDPGFEIAWNCILPDIPPVAEFSSDVVSTCTGIVNFTDESTNGPIDWFWDFGDGSTSTEANPSHTYLMNGNYTVTLTATNGIGSDDEVKTDYIEVLLPDAPLAINDTVCGDEVINFSATSSGSVNWYDAPGGTLLSSGLTYSPGILAVTTPFYAQTEIPGMTYDVGPVDNSFGTGGFFTGNQHLVFDCFQPVILKSVRVYANGAGNRTIQLRNNAGTVIESLVVYIDNGEQVVDLNFEIPVGTNLQLGTEAGSAPDLFRNNAGPSYPYTEAGVIEIKESSAGTDYYYFFYDWQVEEYPCLSGFTEVFGVVESTTFESISGDELICVQGGPTTYTTLATGGTWIADCGGCINSSTGVFDPSAAGEGTFTIDYIVGGASCVAVNEITVTVSSCANVVIEALLDLQIYPNPNGGTFTVQLPANSVTLEIRNIVGQLIVQENTLGMNQILISSILADGTYFVTVRNNEGTPIGTIKMVIQ